MNTQTSFISRISRDYAREKSEIKPVEVVPFGRYGAGIWTGHPVGLVGVFGVLLIGLIALPEARMFLAGALCLGVFFGLFLWLVHR